VIAASNAAYLRVPVRLTERRPACRPSRVRVAVLPLPSKRATIPVGMGKTVLIVDDHSGFRASARELLEAAGFDVVGEAADGASAIAATRELRPDVVLLDIQLPDVDGVQASKLIGAANGGSAIVLTSSRDISYLAGALAECPACGFIPKSELSSATLRELLA
jgi:DNA-binding NarL/FixJ family response regulator